MEQAWSTYTDVMKNRYAQFDGRAPRAEFWWYALVVFLLGIAASIIEQVLGISDDGNGVLSLIVSLAHLVPGLAIGARRLHDIDRSGWWQLLFLIPIVGLIVLIWWFTRPSGAGDNQYGSNPYGQ
ncbi:MAG: DUF805 domain-containing protein [Pseudomonadota bacterium]